MTADPLQCRCTSITCAALHEAALQFLLDVKEKTLQLLRASNHTSISKGYYWKVSSCFTKGYCIFTLVPSHGQRQNLNNVIPFESN